MKKLPKIDKVKDRTDDRGCLFKFYKTVYWPKVKKP